MKIMRGDALWVPVMLTQGGQVLTPEMVEDVEISIGDGLIRKLTSGGVAFDVNLQQWLVRLSQEETLAMEAEETYQVIARVKYKNDPADVKGVKCGKVDVEDTNSEEVI